MNTLNLTDSAFYTIIDAIDEALADAEPHYNLWCSDGNDPINHVWYRLANAREAIDEAVEASDAASYIYNPSKPATFTPPRSLGVHTKNRVRSIDVRQPTEAEWAVWAGKDKIMGDIDTPNAEESYP
jgi:hypothetical protein